MSKKILLTITASLVTLLALAAAAYAGPLSTLAFTSNGSPTIATISGTAAANVTFYFPSVPTTVTCTGSSFSGTAAPGSLTNYATITGFSAGSCGSWTVTSTCTIRVSADNNGQNVDATTPVTNPDTNVTGSATLNTSCLTFQNNSGCAFNVSGNVPANFDETPDGSGDQTLTLSGPGLTASNQSFFCFGLYSGSITTNAPFKVHTTASADWLLNFSD